MARRKDSEESGIGSDSFLDIVANMVGILIILIVIAGMRAGQAPPVEIADAPAEPVRIETRDVADADDAPTWESTRPLDPLIAPSIPEPVVIDLTPSENPALSVRHREQSAALARLEAELRRVRGDASAEELARVDAASQLLALRRQALDLEAALKESRNAYETAKQEHERQSQSLEASGGVLRQLEQELAAARTQLAGAPPSGMKGEVVRHDLTPVSEMIHGHEIHFHLKEGKVARVPIEDMLTLLKSQLERKRDWILKSNKLHGSVGPVEGFRMHYVMQRETLSPLDELRMGSGMVRVSLGEWQIELDETLAPESLAEASQPGSRFQLAIRSASLDTTCTFWVYPDSFEEFRALQKIVYGHELRVAGRPLPEGIPISGSPQGSRSAAQ